MKLSLSPILMIVLCSLASKTIAQQTTELDPGYYVVVGAYAETKEDIAITYVSKLKLQGYDANHGFNTSKKLYFVYLDYFTDLKESILGMQQTRKKGFSDAWVRVVPGSINLSAKVKQETVTNAPAEDATLEVRQNVPLVSDEEVVEAEAEEEEVLIQHDPMTLGNTEVFLSLFNHGGSKIVDGEIEVYDVDHDRLIKAVSGNEYLIMPDPKNNTGKIRLVANVFGYRPVEHEFSYSRPLADTAKNFVDLFGMTFVVHFKMMPYGVGDKTILDKISFYTDAALMMPESLDGLKALLLLMNENPRYQVRLTGHTNGNYRGKIIAVGPSKSYFSIASDSKQESGSSRELSLQRAEVIKLWLADNGISPSRIEVQGLGGKEPLYDTHSVNARKNVRVELEILQD